MKRAVFFDIDGTLLDCQNGITHMTPRVKKAIRELKNRGDYVFIASGRPYAFISKELYLYYDGYGISREHIKSEYDINNIDVYKMDMLCTSREGIDYCMSLKNGEYDYHYNPSNNVFEFYFQKDTKASGIMKALKYLNIPAENSYAFGDDKNDIEMLETAGCGIAMGNASEEVKKHAEKVTDTVQNDGVALAIEELYNNIKVII